MLFAILEEQESMAQRVLMYPRAWDDATQKNDPVIRTSRRLLRDAASRYKVMLQPISPIAAPLLPQTTPGSPETQDEPEPPTYSDEESYPLTNLLSLTTFNRIIYLQPSGIILDATPLDLLFTLPMSDDQKPILGLTSPIPSLADRPAILLLEPSRRNYEDTVAALPEGAYPDTDFLTLVHTIAAASSSVSSPEENSQQHTSPNLLAESSSLHHTPSSSQLNATLFLQTTGYVHFQDEGVKGPEYEVSIAFRDAAPRGNEERRAWEGAYERFREGRMGVCGLDLEVEMTMPEEGDDVDITEGGEDGGEERLLEEGWVEVVGGNGGGGAAEKLVDSGELVMPEEMLPGEANEDLR